MRGWRHTRLYITIRADQCLAANAADVSMQRYMNAIRTSAAVVLSVVLAAGCETVSERPVAEDSEATRIARTHFWSGEYLPAAREYLRLAEQSSGDPAIAYRLDAASAFVLAKRADAARDILAELRGRSLTGDLALRERIVRAQLALVDGHAEQALTLLGPAPGEDTPANVAVRYHWVRADALEANGTRVEAARERVEMELMLTDSVALAENRRRIWETLTQLPPEELEARHIPPPSTLGGWIELASIASTTAGDPRTLEQAVALWRNRFPGHPAGESIVPILMDESRFAWTPARTVALLLPFDGEFANAAVAVRDGFMAAWFADSNTERRPTVIVRDTSAGDVVTIYERAVEEGADFVVGPLRRMEVTRLAQLPGLPVPTLTLNHADAPPGSATSDALAATVRGLYQFALSPESEAGRVAEQAWFAGHSNAVVLTPIGVWGDRVASAFVETWEQLGGTVLESQQYLNDGSDMSATVERLLDVDESTERYRALRQVLGSDIKTEARRRQDVDFVFMAAFPRQARQLRPQLEFHRAQDVPVYSTSHVYTGIPDPTADRDIDGVIFGDMPWVLDPGASGAEVSGLRRQIEAVWSDSLAAFVRLYAFGIDAYRLVSELGRLRAQQYAELKGATGTLSLDDKNTIERRLTWAQFARGVPRVLTEERTSVQ